MITRIYTLNSKKYKEESTYWLTYAFKVAAFLTGKQNSIKYIKQEDILGGSRKQEQL